MPVMQSASLADSPTVKPEGGFIDTHVHAFDCLKDVVAEWMERMNVPSTIMKTTFTPITPLLAPLAAMHAAESPVKSAKPKSIAPLVYDGKRTRLLLHHVLLLLMLELVELRRETEKLELV